MYVSSVNTQDYCFYSFFAKKRNRNNHFKYIRKHVFMPRNCYLSVITLFSPPKKFISIEQSENGSEQKICVSTQNYVSLYYVKAWGQGDRKWQVSLTLCCENVLPQWWFKKCQNTLRNIKLVTVVANRDLISGSIYFN